MSEREEPNLRLHIGEEVLEAKRDNAHLYTHMGARAMYDHLFLIRTEDDGKQVGSYLFHNIQLPPEMFDFVRDFMVENGYHTDLNRTEAMQYDVDAYDANVRAIAGDVENGVPEGWQ